MRVSCSKGWETFISVLLPLIRGDKNHASTPCFYRKFSEEFLSTFAGQKIPKEGTCFDYFYDWQSDGFKDWSTQVCDSKCFAGQGAVFKIFALKARQATRLQFFS